MTAGILVALVLLALIALLFVEIAVNKRLLRQ